MKIMYVVQWSRTKETVHLLVAQVHTVRFHEYHLEIAYLTLKAESELMKQATERGICKYAVIRQSRLHENYIIIAIACYTRRISSITGTYPKWIIDMRWNSIISLKLINCYVITPDIGLLLTLEASRTWHYELSAINMYLFL